MKEICTMDMYLMFYNLFMSIIGMHYSTANILISEERKYFSLFHDSFVFQQKSVLFIRQIDFENNFDLRYMYKQPYSSIVSALFLDNNTLISDVSPTEVSTFSFDCIVMIIDGNKSWENINNMLVESGIIWSLEDQIIIACKNDQCINSLSFDMNSSSLFNGAVININEGLGFRICGSSHSTKAFHLFNNSINAVLEQKCKIDLQGETIPIFFGYNPPMAEFKILTQERKKKKDHVIRNLEEVKGLEVSFLKSLASRFNFKMNIILPVLSNESAYTSKDDIIVANYPSLENGKIKLNGILEPAAVAPHVNKVKITYPLYSERSCIIVDGSLIPRKILNLYEIFEWDVYVGIGITSLLVTVVWIMISKYMDLHNGQYGSLFFMVILLMSNGAVYRDLKAKSEKILILGFLIMNMIILNLFQGNLINMYNKPDDYQEYAEFNNFFDLGIPVLPFRREMAHFFKQYRTNDSVPHRKLAREINKALLLSGNDNDSIGYVITNFDEWIIQGMAILTTVSLAERKITNDVLKDGDTSLIKIDVDSGEGNMVCFMSNQFKLAPFVDVHVMELARSHLLFKWQEESVDKHLNGMIMKSVASKDNHTLELMELKICFILYAIGILFSCAVFIVETVAVKFFLIPKEFWYFKNSLSIRL